MSALKTWVSISWLHYAVALDPVLDPRNVIG